MHKKDQATTAKTRRDGFIEDLHTGKKLPFIKRKGVYFVELYMPKDDSESTSSFTRPVR